MPAAQSIKDRMSRGVAWMMLSKIAERGISLVSTMVLARLLVPDDFGVIVLATSMIGLLEILGAFGFDTALIRQADASREHFDAVWTFNVLFGFGVALMAVALSPGAAWLYGDSRLVSVLLVVAIARAIGGFENIGVISFRKELQFDREFMFLLAKRVATSLLVTLPLAFALRSYWALLLGNLFGTCIAVILSYVVHAYRPRLSLKGLASLTTFSKWLFISNLLEFLHGRAADFIIGRWAGSAALGSFTVAREIARMPTGEIAAPVHRAVFPGYVKLADDRELLRQTYLRLTSVLVLLVIPAGVGLSILAEPIVLILLGLKWTSAVPLVQLLAINAVLSVVLSTGHYVNLAVGMSRSTSLVLALHVAFSLPLMLWLVPSQGASGAALALLLASVVTAPANLILLGKAIRFGSRDVVAMLWRPLTGTLAMSVVVLWLRSRMQWPSGFTLQVGYTGLLVMTGALAYLFIVMACWAPRPHPDTAEAWVVQRVRDVLRKKEGHVRISARG